LLDPNDGGSRLALRNSFVCLVLGLAFFVPGAFMDDFEIPVRIVFVIFGLVWLYLFNKSRKIYFQRKDEEDGPFL